MTAAEAYKRTTDALNDESEYAEDHDEIMADIEDACDDGEYSCIFCGDEYNNMEKHMEDLKKNGFRVEYIPCQSFGSYDVSWEHAGVNSNQ